MKKNHKPSHSKLDLHADDLSKRLQQEEKNKDEHGLTNEGTELWYFLKLSYKLNWDGNYCIPTEGNLEKKTAILREAVNNISYDYREMYEPILPCLVACANRRTTPKMVHHLPV